MSDWPTQRPARGTVLPTSPAVDQEFYWDVDATNHVTWHMIWDVTLSKWLFLGGPPLSSQVDTEEATTSTSYVALATAGPLIALPGVGGGLYTLRFGGTLQNGAASGQVYMSYDIGGTGAVDADAIRCAVPNAGTNMVVSLGRELRRTFATQLTLTAKYRVTSNTGTISRRWMSLLPVQVNPS